LLYSSDELQFSFEMMAGDGNQNKYTPDADLLLPRIEQNFPESLSASTSGQFRGFP